MTAREIISTASASGVVVALKDGAISLKPARLVSAWLQEQVREHKAEIVPLLERKHWSEPLFGPQALDDPAHIATRTGTTRPPRLIVPLDRQEPPPLPPPRGSVFDRMTRPNGY